VYPVGAIYISVSDSSPKTLFGGDWEQIRGRFLLSESADIPAGSYGGEDKHTLKIEEIPPHRHQLTDAKGNQLNYNASAQSGEGNSGISAGESWSNMWTSYTGGGNPFDIMPPYLSVYMWKRTA
jgi:microcystin-dependent protein